MPAFPATIGIPKSSYPLDLDQLESAASQFKSSTQNTVSIKQPQDSEEATEPALEVYFTLAVNTIPLFNNP